MAESHSTKSVQTRKIITDMTRKIITDVQCVCVLCRCIYVIYSAVSQDFKTTQFVII